MRNIRAALAAATVVAIVFVTAASSADTLDVHLVSQTTNNITLGWTPQPGYGYLFSTRATSTAGLVLVSRTNDPSRSTVTFAKGSFSYEVAVIVKGNNGHYPVVVPPPLPACSDGLDNDGDGLVDFPNDPGCTSATDTDEINVAPPPPAQCADGIDNDGDGLVDLADPGCSSASDNDETNSPPPPPGSFPDASTTGVPSGTTLTAYSGPANITTANTVIDSKTIGCIQVSAPGTIIRNSRISCAGGYAVYIDDRTSTQTLVTIQDSEIDCKNQPGSAGVGEADFVLLRVEITGCENGTDVNQNALIQDSFIHNLYNGGGSHADGSQMACGHWDPSFSGSSCAAGYAPGALNVTFRHNTIFGMGDGDTSFGTSAIIQNGNATDTNVTIDNNLLAGGAYTLYCHLGGPAVNNRITNNHFSTRFKSTVGFYGPTSACSDEAVVSGNVYDETGLPVNMG